LQYIPIELKRVLHNRLKAGNVSRPQIRVEVDRYTFIPGYVEEVRFYESELQKVIKVREIKDGQATVTTTAPMTFPLKGLTWSDEGRKFHFTSGFGWRNGKWHNGVDLQTAGAGNASDIVAVYPGKVIKVDYQANGAGYYVNIQHDEGLVTKYFHLKKGSIVVKVGQQVEAGQKIAIEGNTGRARGVVDGGRHLHFEVWKNGKAENPLPWLKGEKKITTKVVTQDNLTETETETVVKTVEVGYPGEVIIDEQMKTYGWMNNPMYKSLGGADVEVKRVSNGYCRTYFKFPQSSTATHSFYINFNMKESGYMNLTYSGNFSGMDGDYLEVWVNGKPVERTTQFDGIDKARTLKDIHIPKGTVQVMIFMLYRGKLGSATTIKQCVLHSFKVQELDKKVPEQRVEEVEVEKPINSDPITHEDFLFNEKPINIQLQTGKFVYQDTLVLPNVQSCEVERNLETEAAEARVTISNPDGYFSPDYNPFYFPELMGRYKPSPWSYYIQGGFHIGVLSENTPIRIYMGYGDSHMKPMRVFTGLIDSCDISGGDGTLTIKARDMYKKLLNTVLLERKEYGNDPVYEETSLPSSNVSNASLTRRQQIYAAAKKAQNEYSLPDDAYYFLLAIAWHETYFGTKGAGRESSGSYILGYGVPDSGRKQSQYAGIEKQMHYGAKRYYEALKSRGHKVDSLDDVKYFWKGGDKGNYQWATDKNWPNGVWAAYRKICADKNAYKPPNTSSTASNTTQGVIVDPPWDGKVYKKPMYNNATVKKIQQKLISLGYKIPAGATGNYLDQTVSAVKSFQKAKGLTVDGIVGQNTWNKLFEKTVEPPKPKLLKEGEYWLKTAIVQDLIAEAGMYGWRASVDDMYYPDAVIEESYLIEMNPRTGKVVRALPEDQVTEEKRFETVDIKDLQVKTPDGWMNPFVERPTTFVELKWKIADAINELIKDTNYRSYCDRYGTYRLERINLNTPEVATYRHDENLITLNKTIDYSRARSHIVVYHDKNQTQGDNNRSFASFIDKELLLELKGEVRTAIVVVPWAKTNEQKREVARKLFFDMKRLSRTIQVSIPGNPALDLLDRIKVIDKNSATVASYHIKGIRDSFDVESGYIQILDLTWSAVDQIIQIPGIVMNTEPPEEPIPSQPPTPQDKCEVWDGKIYKYGIMNNATVKKIQQYLIGQGYSIPAGATGNYLDQTVDAVKAFQRNKKLKVDGIVGKETWNAMFCPSGNKETPPPPSKEHVFTSGIKTRSWRDNWGWRSDNDWIYQGEWENWGHHKGFIFLPYKNIQNQLKGKKIKSIKLYLERVNQGGVVSEQKPTFWLHNYEKQPSGTPSFISGTAWTSNVGWARGDKKWVTLPVSYAEKLRDGKAKGIGIYVSGKSPYMFFYGGSKVKLEIETY
jgi:peptidoglycan hydrolase-like protein with peptidoglycan-binding domain/biotin carboxyl carrier protein